MSDPLSITAHIAAIATLTHANGKALHGINRDIHGTPKSFLDLTTDREALQAALSALKAEFEGNGRMRLYQKLGLDLRLKVAPMLAASSSQKLELMSHSHNGHTSFRDTVKLQF